MSLRISDAIASMAAYSLITCSTSASITDDMTYDDMVSTDPSSGLMIGIGRHIVRVRVNFFAVKKECKE